MKKTVTAAVIVLAVMITVCLCACNGKSESRISLYDLKSAMVSASDSFGDMTYASSEDQNAGDIFSNISDMDYSKIDSFFIYYATEGKGNADEITVVQVKKNADISGVRAELEKHVQKRIALYSTYDKSQLGKLEKAKVEVEGNCVALIVCDENEKVSKAFHSFFN